jgi:hypothetical protein
MKRVERCVKCVCVLHVLCFVSVVEGEVFFFFLICAAKGIVDLWVECLFVVSMLCALLLFCCC